MKSCPSTQETLKRCLEGGLTATEQEALRDHLATCPACVAALTQLDSMEEVVKDAMVPEGSAHGAATHIIEHLKHTQPASTQPITPQPSGRTWIRQWGAIAAVLLFGVGLGFVLQNIQSKPDAGISRKPVAIQVAEVKGTVLVKHRGAQVWETLEADSAVFLGDTFYTTATSNLVLSLGQTNRIEVTPNSMLALESSDKTTEFFLKHGQCTPVLNGPHGPFFIRTPNGRMEALGTEFTVTVTE